MTPQKEAFPRSPVLPDPASAHSTATSISGQSLQMSLKQRKLPAGNRKMWEWGIPKSARASVFPSAS